MRSALVIAVLVCATSAAHAENTRESRYGPTALRPSISLTGSNYGGPVLGWAGKREIAPPEDAATPDLRPLATPWRSLGAVPQQQPAQQAYAAPTQQTPSPAATDLRPMVTPWRSLGAVPQQQPAQQAHAEPRQAQQAPSPAATALVQAQASIAQAPPQYPPQFPGPTSGQPQTSRTYSVGRQYGMIPDAIPPVSPNGMIFIAPSDEPEASKPKASKKDEEPRHGSVEWLAQAPMDPAEGDDAKSGEN